MSPSPKLSAAYLARFDSLSHPRSPGNKKPPRRYFLIVCEGEKTEPNYFEALKKKLPPEMVKRITISGQGKNTLSLISVTQQEIEKRQKSGNPPYYHVWLVFDRDSFPADNFDNTIQTAKSKNWHCAWSNEAFELWYLLHFTNQTGGPLHRNAYQSKLEKELRKTINNYKYKKNADNMYDLLAPLQQNAINNAESALKIQITKQIPPHKMNPATKVHELVQELIRYIE